MLIRENQEAQIESENVRVETEARERRCFAAGFKEVKVVSRSWKRQGDRFSPEPPRGMQPCRPTSDLRPLNWKAVGLVLSH